MSFISKNLAVISYANGFTLWHYKSVDSIVDIFDPKYFGEVSNMINPHDLIIIATDTAGTPQLAFRVVESVSDQGVVLASLV
ncbi:MAG: hypothetical protein JJV93_02735 [Alphaproteobacteria bacterium]|nr:hypothetical protein [Alphaproteobacteria bacterium]MBL0718145.1 hypothetical protein [Alphaproteobacteria bacterium]